MADIVHRLGIHSPVPQVYKALTTLEGLAGWWTEEVAGDPAPGGTIVFAFRTPTGELKGQMGMRVEQLEENSLVVWRCVDGSAEWLDTTIHYELSEQDGQTIVLFAHRGWREVIEFTHHCCTKWATFLLSLREYVETGAGKPSPRDLKIDNWF
jgi:uncharacterized protein YndB with AHSA1/START domain